MKKALKDWRTYIFVTIFILVGFGVAFFPLIASIYTWFNLDYTDFVWNPDWVVLFFFAIYFLIGFVVQDMIRVTNRRKTKNWSGPLPQEVKDNSWKFSLSFYMAAFIMLLAAFIMLLICLANGKDYIRQVIIQG